VAREEGCREISACDNLGEVPITVRRRRTVYALGLALSTAAVLFVVISLMSEPDPVVKFLRYQQSENQQFAVLSVYNPRNHSVYFFNNNSRSPGHLVSYQGDDGSSSVSLENLSSSGPLTPIASRESFELLVPVDFRHRRVAIRFIVPQEDLSPEAFGSGFLLVVWDRLRLLRERWNRPIDAWCPSVLYIDKPPLEK
jgi:hypothetical protein